MEPMNHRRAAVVGTRYLTFEVDGEIYAVPILRVKEILGMREITPLPQTPPAIVGVINLRGLIVPLVDLRIRFGVTAMETTKQTCIVVLDLQDRGDLPWLGVVVDRVHEVQVIPDERISKLSGMDQRAKTQYVAGVADTPSGLRIVIDVERILGSEDWNQLEEASPSSQTP